MVEILRVLMDTNIYGFLVTTHEHLISKLIDSEIIKIYGCRIIRHELRNTPKNETFEGRKIRVKMLALYDDFVQNRDLPVNEHAEALANEYLKRFEGNISKRKLDTDFMIVAIATINRLDMICTNNRKTMASENAQKCFQTANQKDTFIQPKFATLEEFIKKIKN